jgi:hypothetical protein
MVVTGRLLLLEGLTKLEGPISKSRAALISATVANEVVFPLLDQGRWDNLGILFCIELREKMNETFGKEYGGYGVRVTQWE